MYECKECAAEVEVAITERRKYEKLTDILKLSAKICAIVTYSQRCEMTVLNTHIRAEHPRLVPLGSSNHSANILYAAFYLLKKLSVDKGPERGG